VGRFFISCPPHFGPGIQKSCLLQGCRAGFVSLQSLRLNRRNFSSYRISVIVARRLDRPLFISFNYFYDMDDDSKKYRLDKTAFQAMTVQEADDYMRDYRKWNWKERLKISFYLTSLAYGFDINHPPKMDKTVFISLKHSDG
jgi:hypothetical protein